MNEMQLQRVYDELYDVGDRLSRLNSFLDEGGVSKDESRLRKLERMEDELRALKRRD